jgi:hypothetical protein
LEKELGNVRNENTSHILANLARIAKDLHGITFTTSFANEIYSIGTISFC